MSGLDVLYLTGGGDDTPEETVARMTAQVRLRHGPVHAGTVERSDRRLLAQFAIPSGRVVAQLAVVQVGAKWRIEDLAECSTRPAPASPEPQLSSGSLISGPSPESPTADYALPANTAVDWVTYADHVVQIRIDSERRLTATDEERANGEGLIGREVMVTTERTLWSRPGTANPPPARMVWDDGGWIFHGADEQPFHPAGAALRPGHRYLVALTYYTFASGGVRGSEWGPLGSGLVPFDDGVVGHGETNGLPPVERAGFARGVVPMHRTIWGKTGYDVARLLQQTQPDPAAAPYLSLDPRQRYESVVLDENGGEVATPGPGEH